MQNDPSPMPPPGANERQLHDATIQALYAVTLQLENCIHMIEESSNQTKDELNEAIGNLNGVISTVRNRIYELGR